MLFLELRKLERLAEGNDFEKEWLLEILREIVETIFIQISKNKENWATKDDNSTTEHSIMYKQVATYFFSLVILFSNSCFYAPSSVHLYLWFYISILLRNFHFVTMLACSCSLF